MQPALLITVKIIIEKDSGDAPFVAYTPELDIASAGPTEETARKNLSEAVNLVLKGAKEDGNLDELLQEAGFSKQKGEFFPPKVVSEKVLLPT